MQDALQWTAIIGLLLINFLEHRRADNLKERCDLLRAVQEIHARALGDLFTGQIRQLKASGEFAESIGTAMQSFGAAVAQMTEGDA